MLLLNANPLLFNDLITVLPAVISLRLGISIFFTGVSTDKCGSLYAQLVCSGVVYTAGSAAAEHQKIKEDDLLFHLRTAQLKQ